MFYEEFEIGEIKITPERLVTEEELDVFLDVSGLRLPMFQSDRGAMLMGHDKRIVPGPMILSVAMGLVYEAGWFEHVIAVLEFERLRFVRALHPGQSVTAAITVEAKRTTANPQRGLVVLGYEVTNDEGSNVLLARGTYLFGVRDSFGRE